MIIAFIGHKTFNSTDIFLDSARKYIKSLIVKEGADIFLFGSNSRFDELCYRIVSDLKQQYPHIRRVYVRAEYEYIDEQYRDYLLTRYEDTIYPPAVHNAGRRAYIQRNRYMIDKCDKLIVYYDESHKPAHRASGTALAVRYAIQKKKPYYNLCEK